MTRHRQPKDRHPAAWAAALTALAMGGIVTLAVIPDGASPDGTSYTYPMPSVGPLPPWTPPKGAPSSPSTASSATPSTKSSPSPTAPTSSKPSPQPAKPTAKPTPKPTTPTPKPSGATAPTPTTTGRAPAPRPSTKPKPKPKPKPPPLIDLPPFLPLPFATTWTTTDTATDAARRMDAKDTVGDPACDLASFGPPAPDMLPQGVGTVETGVSGNYYCYRWD